MRSKISGFQWNVFAKAFKNCFTRIHHFFLGKLPIFLFFCLIKPIWYFKSVCHRYLDIPKHMSSSGWLFMLTDLENGLTITENRVNFFNNFSKGPALEEQDIGRGIFWPITEKIFLCRMSMEIKIKFKSSFKFLFEACCEFIQMENFRVNEFV